MMSQHSGAYKPIGNAKHVNEFFAIREASLSDLDAMTGSGRA
jgi:hypothetical protein